MKLPTAGSATLYAAASFVAIAIVMLIAMNGGLSEQEIATALLALLGTFAGATFAFRLNQQRDEDALHHAQRQALRRALFVLARQLNALSNIQRDFRRFPAGPLRAFNLPAFQPPPYHDLVHKFEDLEFLYDSKYTNLLLLMSVEQESFHQVLESIRIRNAFYVDEIQPAMAAKNLNGQLLSAQEIEGALGERLFHGAMNGVHTASELIDSSVAKIPTLQAELFAAAKDLYPNDRFIKYVPTDGQA